MWGKLLVGGILLYVAVAAWAENYWTRWDPNTPEGADRAAVLAYTMARSANTPAWTAWWAKLSPAQQAAVIEARGRLADPASERARVAQVVAQRALEDSGLKGRERDAFAREVRLTLRPKGGGAPVKPGTRAPRRRKTIIDVPKGEPPPPKPEAMVRGKGPTPPPPERRSRLRTRREVDLYDDLPNPNLDDVEDDG